MTVHTVLSSSLYIKRTDLFFGEIEPVSDWLGDERTAEMVGINHGRLSLICPHGYSHGRSLMLRLGGSFFIVRLQLPVP